MAEGSLKKTCGCKDANGRRLGVGCPQLRRPGGSWSAVHGRWAYQLELPPPPGSTRRRQLRRSGFTTRDHAADELRHAQNLLKIAGGDPTLRGRSPPCSSPSKPASPYRRRKRSPAAFAPDFRRPPR